MNKSIDEYTIEMKNIWNQKYLNAVTTTTAPTWTGTFTAPTSPYVESDNMLKELIDKKTDITVTVDQEERICKLEEAVGVLIDKLEIAVKLNEQYEVELCKLGDTLRDQIEQIKNSVYSGYVSSSSASGHVFGGASIQISPGQAYPHTFTTQQALATQAQALNANAFDTTSLKSNQGGVLGAWNKIIGKTP